MRKNFTRILAAVAASFAALSCMPDNLEEEPINVLPNQYVATLEQAEGDDAPDTKVSLASDNTTVTWDKGDVIEFINSMAQCVSTWQAGTVDQNGKRAVFDLKSGSAEEQATFAIYRGLSEGCSIGLSVNQPMMISFSMNEQTGLFKDANVMAAKIVDRTLEFKQVFGIFELEVTDSKVKKIVVEGPGIASTVEVTFYKGSSKALDNIKPVGSGRDAITVGNIKPGTWYVAVAPKTYDAGSITISYLDENDAVVTSVKYPNLLTVGRKNIIAFGDISEHTTMSGTLPNGDTFRNYMRQLAGELNNITKIYFYRSISNPQGDIEIAKNVYMSYSNGIISVKTSKSQFTANEDCSSMFDGCYNVTTINGLQYVNTSGTTDMGWMFQDCAKLETVYLSGYFTTANVTNMCDMFYQCEKLEELDLSTWNTRKVTNMNYMFEWTWALRKVILGKNFVIPDGCFVDEMLLGCYATWYGTTEEMESFNKSLVPGNAADYYPGTLQFAIDMGDAGWWSAWNVGAEKPTDFGYYISWGNNTGHMQNGVSDGYSFTESAYKSTDGYSRTTDWQNAPYCDSQWRMPYASDFENLVNNSTVTTSTVNGVSGYKFTHKTNGNSIFLPDAGCYSGSTHYFLPYYWTGKNNTAETAKVFWLKGKSSESEPKYYGAPVRPIAKMGDVAVSGVSLDKTSLTLEAGGSAQLTATVTPSNATIKYVTWTSSNKAVATVNSTGLVKGVSKGTAIITATTDDGSKKATCTVTVSGSKPTGLKLVYGFGTPIEVPAGSYSIEESGDGSVISRVQAVVTPSDAEYDMYWTVSSPSNLKTYSSDYILGSSGGSNGSNPLLFYTATEGRNAAVTLTCTVKSKDGSTTLTKDFHILATVSDKQCIFFNLSYTSSFGLSALAKNEFGSGASSSKYQGMFSSSKYSGYNCYAHFSAPVRETPQYAFLNKSEIKSVKFPSTLTAIGTASFEDCGNLSKIEFNEGLLRIGNHAFHALASSYIGPSDFTLPSTLEYIGSYAFKDVRRAEIIIPARVKTIEASAFYDSGQLHAVRMMGTTPPTLTGNPFGLCPNLVKIYVPYEAYDAYSTALYWRDFKDKLVTY